MLEYKIISKNSCWSYNKPKQQIEKAINEYAKEGWKVVSISFSAYYRFTAYATLERDVRVKNYV